MRKGFLLAHRYAGLTLAAFLIVIGITGSIIAFYEPLEEWTNPELIFVPVPDGREAPTPLAVLDLREKMQREDPHSHVYFVHFPHEKNKSVSMYVEAAIDAKTGDAFDIGYDELFANPHTGERINQRQWGDFSPQRKNLISAIYFLHYSLVLPEELGEGFMGIVALFWAMDCFVGLMLTLPAKNGGNFWQRWKPSWMIKTTASKHRVIYDMHRAISLWVWLFLLMFAWSGFALNLPTAYKNIMNQVAKTTDNFVQPELEQPLVNPAISWKQALTLGEKYMTEQSALHHFDIKYPTALIYRREKGFYDYRVYSSRDLISWGYTSVAINAKTGALIGVQIPTGHETGTTFTSWIKGIHMAMVGGFPVRFLVSLMGLVVVLLSVTGVVIWLRKRLPKSRSG